MQTRDCSQLHCARPSDFQKCIVYKFRDMLSCAHLTFRLCFLWRKWYGTLRQAEYFLATIAGQKNVGKIHPWRVETPIHWITRVPELSGTPRITTNIPTPASACDHIYMFTQYHDPSPGRTWTLFPHYSVIVLTSISINIHNIRRRRPLAPCRKLLMSSSVR